MVIVREARGWLAFFATDPAATVADILAAVADRFSLEIAFRDLKEIVGAGQQQTRFHFANVGAFHLLPLDLHADGGLVVGAPRGRVGGSPVVAMGRRAASPEPCGQAECLARELLREEFTAVLSSSPNGEELLAAAERLLQLAA